MTTTQLFIILVFIIVFIIYVFKGKTYSSLCYPNSKCNCCTIGEKCKHKNDCKIDLECRKKHCSSKPNYT